MLFLDQQNLRLAFPTEKESIAKAILASPTLEEEDSGMTPAYPVPIKEENDAYPVPTEEGSNTYPVLTKEEINITLPILIHSNSSEEETSAIQRSYNLQIT